MQLSSSSPVNQTREVRKPRWPVRSSGSIWSRGHCYCMDAPTLHSWKKMGTFLSPFFLPKIRKMLKVWHLLNWCGDQKKGQKWNFRFHEIERFSQWNLEKYSWKFWFPEEKSSCPTMPPWSLSLSLIIVNIITRWSDLSGHADIATTWVHPPWSSSLSLSGNQHLPFIIPATSADHCALPPRWMYSYTKKDMWPFHFLNSIVLPTF